MSTIVQIRRGNVADLPTLEDGELGLAEDTNTIYIGDDGSKVVGKLKKSYRAVATVTWGDGGTIAIESLISTTVLENTIGTTSLSVTGGALRVTSTNNLTADKTYKWPAFITDIANARLVKLFAQQTSDDSIDYNVDVEESVGTGDEGTIEIAIDVYY